MPKKRSSTGRPRGRPRGSLRYDDQPLLLAMALARWRGLAGSDWAAARLFEDQAEGSSRADRLHRQFRKRRTKLLAEARRIDQKLRDLRSELDAAPMLAIEAERMARDFVAMAAPPLEPATQVRRALRDLFGDGCELIPKVGPKGTI